jgi:hypothetical protein
MKKIIAIAIFFASISNIFAQETTAPKIGWFVTPEVGVMFLDNHIGNSIGASFGLKLWKNRLKLGIMASGRPGPINPATFDVKPINNQTYKGQSSLKLRADWGTFGLMVAPTFKIKDVEVDVPITIGGGAGGFYLLRPMVRG